MLIANISDLHARGKDLASFQAQWEAALTACVERKVDLMTIAGDVFDRSTIGDRHASTGAIIRAVVEPIGAVHPGKFKMVCIDSNHDRAGAGSETALSAIEACGVAVFRNPGWMSQVKNEYQSASDGIDVCCLPWNWAPVTSAEETVEALWAERERAADPSPRKTMLLAHVQVIGAKMAGLKTCDSAPWFLTREFLERMPFDRYALGDFHERQDLSGGRGGYVGALRQLTFGEEGNPAGFEIWNTETNKVEWIELDLAPKYRTVHIKPGEDLPDPRSNERLRIIADGFIPDRVEAARVEALGAQVEAILPTEERLQRVYEIPVNIIDRPEDLLCMWAGSRTPPIEAGELSELFSEMWSALGDESIAERSLENLKKELAK